MKTVRIDVILKPDGTAAIADVIEIQGPVPEPKVIPEGAPVLVVRRADSSEAFRTVLPDTNLGDEAIGPDGSLSRVASHADKILSFEIPFPGDGGTLTIEHAAADQPLHGGRVELQLPSPTRRRRRRAQFTMKADDRWGIHNPNALTLAFMAEAFTEAQHHIFDATVDRCLERLEQIEAFQPVLPALRVMRIYIPSNEDRLGGDTYFSARFQDKEPKRVLRIDEKRARQTLNDHILTNVQGIVVVNTTEFGGAGGTTAVVSAHPDWAPDILAHELGHSLFGLADEYATAGQNDIHLATEPNVSRNWERQDLKWADLIPSDNPYPVWTFESSGPHPEGIGAFQGAKYNANYWRPSYDCKMRDLASPKFCPVCTREIRRHLQHRLIHPNRDLV